MSLEAGITAQIIAIGSELLTPSRIDTDSLFLTTELNNLGIAVTGKMVAADNLHSIAEALEQCLVRCDLVMISGGLGPTEDDLTRQGVAMALGRGLSFHEEILDEIRERFRKFGRPMAERNRRQAYVIDGARILPNPNGTAPGQAVEIDGKLVFLLPGPPRELMPMVRDHCLPMVRQHYPLRLLRTFTFRIAGLGESDVDERVAPIYTRYVNPQTTILAAAGDITLQFRATAETEEEAEQLLAAVIGPVREELGERIYSENGDSLEETVVKLLGGRAATLAVAESCTGGSLAARITDVPGASNVFLGGFLVYTDGEKEKLVGVDPARIAAYTSVSAEVAVDLAANTRDRTGAAYALSVTGYAGPGGGTEENPVGTVYIALASASGVSAKRHHFHGDRERVRRLATQYALDMLRIELLHAGLPGTGSA
ncbi:MAG: competence/damage-inducible protein A [Bryobacterales bacterium]|nr:competence/damage-inducible protein A [Bryobacterales bacterium]